MEIRWSEIYSIWRTKQNKFAIYFNSIYFQGLLPKMDAVNKLFW